MKRLVITAVALALVGGIIGGMVGNPFGRSASTSAAGVGGRLIELGTISVGPNGTGEFPMVNVGDCARMTAMARAPEATSSYVHFPLVYGSPDGSIKIGHLYVSQAGGFADGAATALADIPARLPYLEVLVVNSDGVNTLDITGWIWCATSPSYAVGGIAEPPDLATRTGASGMGTYAVLGSAVSGGLAFAAMGIFAVKRRGVKQ